LISSVLLDTSFLISLSDPARPHHETAKSYYREFIQRGSLMFLSAVVASEFHVKQSINDLELRNFIVLPFNIDHAMACGLLLRELTRDAGDDRVRVKDDLKLIAQCQCEGITHLATEDTNTLVKYLDRLRASGRAATRALPLVGGFDVALFENGQARLIP
jgi:predicted nucleic acid-binding protein